MLTGLMIFLQNPGILQKHTSPKEYHIFLRGGREWGVGGAYDSGQHHNSKTVTIKTSPLKTVKHGSRNSFAIRNLHRWDAVVWCFYGHDTSNWSAGGVEKREKWISGNSFTTRAQRTAETQHQHAVRGGGAEFHIHFSSGLWDHLFQEPS